MKDGKKKVDLQALISTCQELGVFFGETASKVKEKFSLGDEETRKNMQLYWKKTCNIQRYTRCE